MDVTQDTGTPGIDDFRDHFLLPAVDDTQPSSAEVEGGGLKQSQASYCTGKLSEAAPGTLMCQDPRLRNFLRMNFQCIFFHAWQHILMRRPSKPCLEKLHNTMMVEMLPPLPATCKCRVRVSELTERSVIVRSLVSDSMWSC